MNFKKITALSLALALSAGITVNAATSLPATEKSDKEGKKIELKEGFFKKRHHGDGLYRTAKEIGITKEEMKNAREKGTNFFDMAKQKGFTEQQVKDMMLKNKSEALDKEVENGKLTKEKAEEIKSKMKEKISNWDGILRNHKGKIENKEDEKKKQ
jgi:FtsZ-binding cell division protein ZapB